ncbi:MAG TPA: choice-of-anchor D domain-containing protein, partial [Myxococcota bacterium]
MLRALVRLVPLALPVVFAACNCDNDLGHIGPNAILVHGSDETPPLDILKVALDPTPLSTSVDTDFTLKNTGNRDLLVSSIVFGTDPDLCPTASGAFTVKAPDGPEPHALDVKKASAVQLTIAFTPTSGSPACAIVEVHSNDGDHAVLEALITGQGDAPQLCTDRAVIDFGDVVINDTKNDTVHLTSCGTRAITITNASLNAEFPDPFTAGSVSLGTPIAPGAAIDIPVTFHPLIESTWTIPGGTSGTIKLDTDAPQAPSYQVDLVGASHRPPSCEIQVIPSAVQFGDIGQNLTSTAPVIVKNIGQLACTFTSAAIRAPAGDFSLANDAASPLNPGDTLQPQQSGTFQVTFAPTAVNGAENGFLDIITDDPVSPNIAVPLEGTSVEVTPCFLQAQPSSVSYGTQPLFHSAERTITVTNVGTDTCNLTSAALTSGAPDFHVLQPAFPFNAIFAGSHIDIIASFRPESAGTKS